MNKVKINYAPKAGVLWDHWLYKDKDGIYHMYYLFDERSAPIKNSPEWVIGHAVSDDLVNWTEQAVALRPDSKNGAHTLATGSVISYKDEYIMLVTDHDNGIYLAKSKDLYNWEYASEKPVLDANCAFYEARGQMRNNPEGCAAWADPYLFTKPDDDALYVVFNARVPTGEVEKRGAIALAKSYDALTWEIYPPIYMSAMCMRCETPQIFFKNNRWYLLYSGHNGLISDEFKASMGVERFDTAALVLTSEKFEGPYELSGYWKMFEDSKCYICKIIEDKSGKDCVLTIVNNATMYPPQHGETGISMPFPVSYPEEGGISVIIK